MEVQSRNHLYASSDSWYLSVLARAQPIGMDTRRVADDEIRDRRGLRGSAAEPVQDLKQAR